MPSIPLFISDIVPRILSVLPDGWERGDDGHWRRAGADVFFGSGGKTIDHWLKPEIIVATLKKSKGKVFCHPKVGWGYYGRGRWHVETWDGRSESFRKKSEAQERLHSLTA